MRLTAIMLFVCIGLAYASESYSQSTTLTLNVNNKTVQEVLDEIEKQSEFHFFYNNKQVNTNRVVSIKSKKKDVFNVLEQLFNGTDISYKVLDKSIILSHKEMLMSAVVQQSIKNISGTITDSNGEPIIGANVFKDFFAGIRDIVGGRAGSYESVLREAKETALKEMSDHATQLGANAVIAIDLDYETVGGSGSMLMVTAAGTAVRYQ